MRHSDVNRYTIVRAKNEHEIIFDGDKESIIL